MPGIYKPVQLSVRKKRKLNLILNGSCVGSIYQVSLKRPGAYGSLSRYPGWLKLRALKR